MSTHASGRVTVVTPTYRPDLEITRALCHSIDAHFRLDYQHLLIVPRGDLARFDGLNGPNRVVLNGEALLRPHGFRRLPFPSRLRIPGLLDRRFREQWIKRGTGRMTGWLVQQILKLQSAEFTSDELLVFIDSDVQFVRDVNADLFFSQGKVRLHRGDQPLASTSHHHWRSTALRLIGLDPEQTGEASYIGNVVTWTRTNLLALLARIEEVTGEDWQTAIARAGTVSEYMLYGYFADYMLPMHGGHEVEPFRAVHSLWTRDEAAQSRFLVGFQEHHVAAHVQSAAIPDAKQRQRLIQQAVVHSGLER